MPDERFEAGQRFSVSDIHEIEKALGRNLPRDYIDFVEKYGGAFVGGLVDNSDSLPILKFFAAGDGRGILGVLNRYADLKADSALPFARDELGNIYVLDKKDEIFYINYYGGNTNAQKISNNFGNFLSRIVVDRE